jgi:ubiquitin C-terminal hydrolase
MHAAHFSTLAPVGASAQVGPAPAVSAAASDSVSHRSVLGSMSSQQYHHQRAESRSSITYNSNNYPERSLSEMERERDLEDELEEAYDPERRIVANSRRSSYDPAKRDGLTTAVGYAAAQAQAQATSPPLSRQVSLLVPAGAIASASSGTRMRALVGLSNLGNTCFLNSTLQCLLSTPAFLPYFASGAYERDINPRGARTRGALAQAFGDLAKKMVMRGSDHSVERPAAVKQAVAIIDNKFSGYGQHDSHEFGRVLLSALHDELNRVVTKPPYEEIKDGENDSDAVKADRWWRNHTERNQSIVMECFAGQLQSSLVCQSCRRRSEAFDPFLDLSLPIPKAPRGGGLSSALSRFSLGGSSSSSSGAVSRCTLLQCFDEFVREELLTGHEQVYCRACKTHRDHSKKLHVYRWPRMLVLHLKRFSYGSHTRAKINTDVDFPHQLDMRSLAGAAHKQMGPGSAPVYALYGVSAHMGTAAGGHYVAHAKVADADNAPFYTFNDSVVHAEGPNACKGPSAYLLFYRQKD